MIARPHVALSHACRGTSPLSARPAGDTRSGGRSAAGQLGVAVVSTSAHEYDDCSTARQPRRQFARARWCDHSTARWSHACPGTPPLSARPAKGAGGGGRSAAGQLGVAVVSTRAHEFDDCSTARRPRRQFARARWCDCSTARWSHACPGTPLLSARPTGDTGGSGRSAAGQLGVAVVSTRANE